MLTYPSRVLLEQLFSFIFFNKSDDLRWIIRSPIKYKTIKMINLIPWPLFQSQHRSRHKRKQTRNSPQTQNQTVSCSPLSRWTQDEELRRAHGGGGGGGHGSTRWRCQGGSSRRRSRTGGPIQRTPPASWGRRRAAPPSKPSRRSLSSPSSSPPPHPSMPRGQQLRALRAGRRATSSDFVYRDGGQVKISWECLLVGRVVSGIDMFRKMRWVEDVCSTWKLEISAWKWRYLGNL